MRQFVAGKECAHFGRSFRPVIAHLPAIGMIVLIAQVCSVTPAHANWETIVNCVPDLHRAQIGNQTLIPGVQETFSPPTVTVDCLSRDDGSLFEQNSLNCPNAANDSISIRWRSSKVDGRCNPREDTATTEGSATQDSETQESTEGSQ